MICARSQLFVDSLGINHWSWDSQYRVALLPITLMCQQRHSVLDVHGGGIHEF